MLRPQTGALNPCGPTGGLVGAVAFAEGDPMTQPTDPAAPARRPSVFSWTFVGAFALAIAPATTADDADGGDAYLAFIRAHAADLRGGDAPPRLLADWTDHRR